MSSRDAKMEPVSPKPHPFPKQAPEPEMEPQQHFTCGGGRYVSPDPVSAPDMELPGWSRCLIAGTFCSQPELVRELVHIPWS